MTEYENDQVDAIRVWKSKEPSVVSKTVGFVSYPVIWLMQKIVPVAAIRGVLDCAVSCSSLGQRFRQNSLAGLRHFLLCNAILWLGSVFQIAPQLP